jgi:RimJ/RimL family protein N-acetyltransferase
MIIKSENFRLRPPTPDDATNIYKYQRDSGCRKNFMSTPKSINEVLRDFRKRAASPKSCVFVIDICGEAAGEIGLSSIEKNHKAKLTFWIASKHRGKGIMTSALRLFLNYAFRKYKLRRIYGHVRTFNKASARVFEKNGFKLEGILRKNKLKNGKYMDDFLYAKVV